MSERAGTYDASPASRPGRGAVVGATVRVGGSAVGQLLVGLCARLGVDPAATTVAELVELLDAGATARSDGGGPR